MVPAQEARPALAAGGPHLASEPGTPAVMGIAPEGPDALLSVCDQALIQTIMDSRATSTRALRAYVTAILARHI